MWNLPGPEIEPVSLHWQADSDPLSHWGSLAECIWRPVRLFSKVAAPFSIHLALWEGFDFFMSSPMLFLKIAILVSVKWYLFVVLICISLMRSNQSILKETSPEYSLEGLMLKRQCFGHLIRRTDSFEKTLMLGKIEGGRKRGRQDEIVGWHHQLDGHKFEQVQRVGDGQGGLVCCSP